MKRLLLTIMPLLLLAATAWPENASPDPWADWKFLLGTWTSGESRGVPGQASKGSFSLAPELDGKILVRKNHAEYPPANGRPAIVHDDLMIVYQESGATKAFYTDSEGHVIRYNVTVAADKKKIVLLSEKSPGPQYRLTYEDLRPGAAKVVFEFAPPDKPEQFTKYVEATVNRQ